MNPWAPTAFAAATTSSVVGLQPPEEDVLLDRAVEQEGLLRDDAHLSPQAVLPDRS